MTQSAVNAYRDTAASTASRERILIMLYEGAVSFTRVAAEHLSKGNLPGKGVYISKAQAIVSELMATLNHEVGGDVAKKLEQLYLYLGYEFTRANMNNDPSALANALRILEILHQAFVEAVAQEKQVVASGGA